MASSYQVRLSSTPLLLLALGLMVIVLPATAAERFWIDANGGSFGFTSNWSATSGGASGASVPGVADRANFDLNATYEVDFSLGSPPTNTDLDIENGNVTFDLNNATYTLTSTSAVAIGFVAGQTGRLTVTDGTLAVDTTGDDVTLGFGNSSGFLTVTTEGRIGDDVNNPDVVVGSSSSGSLTVNSNGQINADDLLIGLSIGSSGTTTVTGPQAVVDVDRSVSVGSSGGGTLNIFNGGSLATGLNANIGVTVDGVGFAQVNGTGSSWDIGSSTLIGSSGEGTLTVSSGGRVSSLGTTTVGSGSSGDGTLTVTGANSVFEMATLTVGNSGIGNLTVSSGGRVTTTTAGTSSLASITGSEGRVTVTGTDSQLSLASQMSVGRSGLGALTVSSGGQLESATMIIGDMSTGTGMVTVTGAGSKQTVNGTITVSDDGEGTLNVLDSGEVYTGGLTIDAPGGTPGGTANLDGGSIFVDGNFQNFGELNFTDGLLQVSGTFQPLAAAGTFTINGEDNGDLPTLDLIGSGAQVNMTALTVGSDNRAMLMVRQSRSVVANSGVLIGADFGGEGTVIVDSGGSLSSTGTIAVGGTTSFARGTGLMQVGPGGTVTATTLRVFGDGTVNLHGGTLGFSTIDIREGGQFDWTTGALRPSSPLSVSDALTNELFGPTQTMTSGQVIDAAISGVGEITLNTSLTVDGGVISLGRVTNNNTLRLKGGTVRSLLPVSGSTTNTGIVLLEDPLALFGGQFISNTGTIRGTGTLGGLGTTGALVANEIPGQIQVLAGERMVVNSGLSNSGHVSVIGGELQVEGSLTNVVDDGLISARNAILRFNGGVTNNSGMAISNGTVDVYGDITQNIGGRVTVSNGGIANFYDDVTIAAGAANVQATALGSIVSRVVFFGDYNGGVTGGGQAFIEGDHRPGNSPAEVDFEGDVFYGPFSTLEIEIAGLLAGSEFDWVDVAGEAALTGALEVSLLAGFEPQAGHTFEILTADGGVTGTFFSESLPDLSGDLLWNVNYGTNNIVLEVVTPYTADFDGDGDVDGDDLNSDSQSWEARYGSDLDGGNFLDWQRQLGSGIPGLAAAHQVPEPATWVLLLAMVATWPTRRTR